MSPPVRALTNRLVVLTALVCMVLVTAACASDDRTVGPGSPSETPSSGAPTTPADQPQSGDPGEPASEIKWLDTQLTDAVTGQTFTLADYKGKPVLLHAFAVW